MKQMAKTLIFAIITLTILLGFQQSYAIPEIDDEVIVGFEHGDAPAIPNWVKSQFEWYVNGEIDEKTLLTSMNWMFDNNIMHLSPEAAQEVQEMRHQIAVLTQELSEANAAIAIPNLIEARKGANESSAISTLRGSDEPENIVEDLKTIDNTMEGYSTKLHLVTGKDSSLSDEEKIAIFESVIEVNVKLHLLIDSLVVENSDLFDEESLSRVKVKFPWMSDSNTTNESPQFDFTLQADLARTSETIEKLVTNGVTDEDDWDEAIDQLAIELEDETVDSVVDDLQGIVVLCNIEIDKQAQQIDAELKIIEQWLEIISEKQNTSTYDSADRITSESTTASTSQYNESDLEFITRTLDRIDQEIASSQVGLSVLETKIQTSEGMTQMMQLELQDAMNKQQQTLQTISNVSKMLHDTQMSIIRNMK